MLNLLKNARVGMRQRTALVLGVLKKTFFVHVSLRTLTKCSITKSFEMNFKEMMFTEFMTKILFTLDFF